jgi:predicted LPLAT superfamily acyltransferase
MKSAPEAAGSPPSWDSHRERSTPAMLTLLVGLTLFAGRPVMRALLWPVVCYFWLTGPRLRAASREILLRATSQPPRSRDILRHFHAFATVFIDRVYLLAGRASVLDINAKVPEEALAALRSSRGCLLLGAHFGSFEVLRIKGMLRNEAPIRIVLDRQVGRMAMSLLERLDPALAARTIDAARRGPDLVLDIKQAIEAGDLVGMMADRARADERSVEVDFLGGRVRLPAGPWMIAAALDVPVLIGFGVYLGGNRYECRLELFERRVLPPRATRAEALQAHAQRYARRLEEQVRAHPGNWFNFHDYWLEVPPAP